MKNNKVKPNSALGRCYTTRCEFALTLRESLRMALGGRVHMQVRIFVAPGASSIPSEIVKDVQPRQWRWPWRKAS